MLMFSYPERDLFIRSDVMHRALPTLAKKKRAFADEGMLTTTDYLEIRTFAEAVRDKIAALAPRDMIDVQGFMWSTLGHRALWFGGFSYRSDAGQTQDMLEIFRARDVYAVGYGFEPPIRALVADQVKLNVEDRKKGAARIEAAASSSKEAETLNAFVEMAARPGEWVIAKSTYYQEQSILRIRGVASVRGEVGFDPELGQTVSVIWSDPVDVGLSNKAFNKLAGTLVALPLAEALDVFGSEEIVVQPRENRDPVGPKPSTKVGPPPVQPDLPKNLILYGPPGT
jgi:hypothetical protein